MGKKHRQALFGKCGENNYSIQLPQIPNPAIPLPPRSMSGLLTNSFPTRASSQKMVIHHYFVTLIAKMAAICIYHSWVDQYCKLFLKFALGKKKQVLEWKQDFLQKIQGIQLYYVYIIVYPSSPLTKISLSQHILWIWAVQDKISGHLAKHLDDVKWMRGRGQKVGSHSNEHCLENIIPLLSMPGQVISTFLLCFVFK